VAESNIAETVAELTRQTTESRSWIAADGREFLLVPEGMTKVEIPDEHGLKKSMPTYLAQLLTLQAVDSLVDYTNRFKISDTVLFADIEDSRIVAVLDYHSASNGGSDGVGGVSGPSVAPSVKRAAHRASMELPFSEEWKAWTAIDGVLMKQLDFARFLEENAAEVAAPSGAELLEVVRDIQALRKVNFIQAVRTASESENFEYRVESDASAKGVEIPTKFKLSLPVYFGEAPSELFAFLRWNIDENAQLKLGVKLHRRELVRQAVFKQIVLAVGDKTSCPVVFGSLD
jgi:uncharacterized protein YfdQ (DUF2303 family)